MVEAWETILGDNLWQVQFKSKEDAKKALDSKALSEIRRLYSASLGRKCKSFRKIMEHWGREDGGLLFLLPVMRHRHGHCSVV